VLLVLVLLVRVVTVRGGRQGQARRDLGRRDEPVWAAATARQVAAAAGTAAALLLHALHVFQAAAGLVGAHSGGRIKGL